MKVWKSLCGNSVARPFFERSSIWRKTVGGRGTERNMFHCLTFVMALFFVVPALALAQSPARVGILVQEMGRSQAQAIKGLSEELKRLGYQERKNLIIETRNVKGNRPCERFAIKACRQ